MAGANDADVKVLRELAKRYLEVTQKEVYNQRRKLWTDHNTLIPTRPLILINFGLHNAWCRDLFGDHAMSCQDDFYRHFERELRMALFHDSLDDDWIAEPWILQFATRIVHPHGLWGVPVEHERLDEVGTSYKFNPPIREWSDAKKLVPPRHEIDEQTTAQNHEKLQNAIGDILPIVLDRTPLLSGFSADLSTQLVQLRGLEQVMTDMYEFPDELHAMLAFMRDAVLTAQQQAEDTNSFHSATQHNQAMCYAHELPLPALDEGPLPRKKLWAFCAAQEFALVSPAMHEEFLLNYQLPILQHYGLVAYGCCEDLTRKIDLLRRIPNLRRIAVSPMADVAACAEQIKQDYVLSWRPSPADMVGYSYDESRIRRIITHGLTAARSCRLDITLKDVETVQGEPDRLKKWIRLVREIIDREWK